MKTEEFVIDSLEFARRGREVSGLVSLASLTRLADLLANDAGELAWSVSGELAMDRFGKQQAYLLLEVRGEVSLVCQRCLSVMKQALDIGTRLLLVPPGAPWPEDGPEDESGEGAVGFDEDADPVEALVEQRVLDLVEDEVLLALPIVPRHAACELPEHDDGRAAASPFAALAKLKRTH